MDNSLPQFQLYKEKIPEFIVKLYHILERRQYQQYLSWHSDSEIVIKSGKRLEDKVLPHFFRHRHLSSFIRQLNMYKFSKITKLTKQKNYMYFKNQHFQRGQIEQMVKIKRNSKKSKKDLESLEEMEEDQKLNEVSINNQLNQINANPFNPALAQYKDYVKNNVREIVNSLKNLEASHPDVKAQLRDSLAKCRQLLEMRSQNSSFSYLNFDEPNANKNMMSTMKILPSLQPVFFPSQCSFFQIN